MGYELLEGFDHINFNQLDASRLPQTLVLTSQSLHVFGSITLPFLRFAHKWPTRLSMTKIQSSFTPQDGLAEAYLPNITGQPLLRQMQDQMQHSLFMVRPWAAFVFQSRF